MAATLISLALQAAQVAVPDTVTANSQAFPVQPAVMPQRAANTAVQPSMENKIPVEVKNSDPIGILDASPEKKQSIVTRIEDAQKSLSVEAAHVAADKKAGLITSNEAKTALQNINTTNQDLEGAKSLLTGNGSKGPPPTPAALAKNLETIRWIARPVWAVCGGKAWRNQKDETEWKSLLAEFEDQLAVTSRSIGLVRTYDNPADNSQGKPLILRAAHVGTAIVVGPHLIATNKHVVKNADIAYEEDGEWILYPSILAEVEFPREYSKCLGGPAASLKARVIGIEPTPQFHNDDIIILRVDIDLPPAIRFAPNPEPGDAELVAVIGYPARPNLPFLTETTIRQIFGVPDKTIPFPAERISLGYIIPNTTLPGYFSYDASTWGGSSGSVVLSLATGQPISIHVAGLDADKEGVGYNIGLIGGRIAHWQTEKGY